MAGAVQVAACVEPAIQDGAVMGSTLSKKPVNGMKDILPREMEIRDYVTGIIKETYRSFGFTPIETPCMENIANLQSNQGGENEKLIFRDRSRGCGLWYALRPDPSPLQILCE